MPRASASPEPSAPPLPAPSAQVPVQVPVPVAAAITEEEHERAERVAREKNQQGWNGLRRFAHPFGVAMVVGTFSQNFHVHYGNEVGILEPIVSVPLAMAVIASLMTFAYDDVRAVARDYAYMVSKGLIISAALALSIPAEFMFRHMNKGFFEHCFTGNLLHDQLGSGLRTLAIWRGIDLVLNPFLVRRIYG